MSRPGIEPVTSRSPERTLYQLSYRGRSYKPAIPHQGLPIPSSNTYFFTSMTNVSDHQYKLPTFYVHSNLTILCPLTSPSQADPQDVSSNYQLPRPDPYSTPTSLYTAHHPHHSFCQAKTNKCLVSGNVSIFFRVGRQAKHFFDKFFIQEKHEKHSKYPKIEEKFSDVLNTLEQVPKKKVRQGFRKREICLALHFQGKYTP